MLYKKYGYIFVLKKKKELHFLTKTKSCIAHCKTVTFFSNHTDFEFEHTSSRVNTHVNKILVIMFACSKTDYYFSLFTWNQKEERVYSELQSQGIRQSGPTSWMRKERKVTTPPM